MKVKFTAFILDSRWVENKTLKKAGMPGNWIEGDTEEECLKKLEAQNNRSYEYIILKVYSL